ncbi:MAG: hypothetical protein FVQ83_03050 [Chloroflexi bacterium]|nr:hypothetical protein [Chloroflexota bacterium]
MDITGLGLVLSFFGLIVGFSFINRRRSGANLREIPAFSRLRNAIELAVEDGTRLHISIGRGDITGPQSTAAFVGLSMLKRITTVASDSDNPPIATAGDGALALLAQDTLRSTYQSLGALNNYDITQGRAAGLTPFSFAAGTLPIISDEDVSANILVGSFGTEIGLITTTGGHRQTLSLAGTDNIPAQAILYATADEQLIGEELYAGGAYVGAGPMHIASLHAQDIMRWALIAIIIIRAFGELLTAL